MKYLLIAGVIIVIYFVVTIGFFIYKYKHLAKLEEFVRKDVILGQGSELRYIAAGDSTAAGLGATRVENTYPDKIALELSKTHEVYYKNVGIIGAKTKDLIARELQQIIDYNPDIVTISIGANDATHLVSEENILENEKQIIKKLSEKTHAQIYLTDVANFSWGTVLPKFYKVFLEIRDGSTNKEIKALETDRVKIVDVHDFGWSQFPDPAVTNSADGFHPNDLGYQNWTAAFLDRILK